MKGDWTAKKIRTDIFKHNNELYKRYDTRQKVLRNSQYQRAFNNSINVVNFTTPTKK